MTDAGSQNAEYIKTLDFLYRKLPMFSRVGSAAIKKGLGNIEALCQLLDNPQQNFRSIHIAGTNGKGSVAHMLAAVGTAAGIKTGLYTSPHYLTFRERIKINGQHISEESVIEYVEELMPAIEKLQPSFFEITVAMAFIHFARERVEWAIIETGLGGRLDSTNIIVPEFSIITNISLEHTDMLGDTIAAIAFEKAGIIKSNKPVIIGRYDDESRPVFEQVAASKDAPIRYAADIWDVSEAGTKAGRQKKNAIKKETEKAFSLELQAMGKYQNENLATVLSAYEVWESLDERIDLQALQSGLYNLIALSNFQGRWQVVQENPTLVADSAHNAGGIAHLQENLKQHKFNQLHIVLGMVSDKSHDAFLQQLPEHAHFYFTEPSVPRKLSVEELGAMAKVHKLSGPQFDRIDEAIAAAKKAAATDDLILVTGSCFLVADFLSTLHQ